MEAKDWIRHILEKEVQDSAQKFPSELHARLLNIPKGLAQMISWKQVVSVAAGLALLISLNLMVFDKTSSHQQDNSDEFRSSYFSHLSLTQ